MSDFDLLNDAENFEDEYEEPDIPDDFLEPKEIESKKRVLDNDNSNESSDKRVKPAGCLADYFVDNNLSQLTQSTDNSSKKSSQGGNDDFTKQSNYGTDKNANVNAGGDKKEKGPLCSCGTSSTSKTTLKDGPNKDRKFWVCSDSQCKFFEWRDALNSFDSDATTQQQQQNKSAGPNGNEEEKGPQCSCGMSSISKTTFKEGANKDRKFWVCGADRDSQCKFFEWRDAPKPQTQNMSFNSGNQQQQQQTTSSGPQCKCGIPCVSRTTTKEGPNKGKAFWCCSAQQGSQCKFFEWAVPEGQNNQGGSANNNNNYSNNNNGGNNNCNYGNNGGNNSNNYGNNGGNNNYGNNNNNSYGNNGGNNNGNYGNNGGNNNSSYGNNGGNSNGNYGNNSGSNTQKSGTCYKCGEAGHWSTNCPKQGGGGGGYKNGGQGGGGYKKY